MRTPAALLAIVGLGCLLAACRHEEPPAAPTVKPSLLSQEPLVPVLPPTPETTTAPADPRTSPSSSPSPTGFPETQVSYCNGKPSGAQVLAAVRKARPNLPSGGGVKVQTEPVCSGVWQYTILSVTDSEPLRVITKGSPASLTVVTVGTDPCTVEVRAAAPIAFLDAVDCN
ncbi:hypothetical protein ACQP1P_46725 [Dactylosporangium sp. CA-052675]|uniref:hypothetical protein n=1 Tax=Dactylosporangium sp. CA-052675 TaxID=3239927 RepID=UPI003D947224